MWVRRTLLCALALLLALVIQVAFLARLSLPGAVPDLVLVTVVALALAFGPTVGGASGFAAGLALDLTPPADGIVGVMALIGLAIGVIAGAAVDPRDRTVLVVMAMTGASTGGAVLGYAALTALLGSDRVAWSQVPALALTAGIYGILLSMAVMPLMAWIVRRITPETVL